MNLKKNHKVIADGGGLRNVSYITDIKSGRGF
jgi:hypothetical protein